MEKTEVLVSCIIKTVAFSREIWDTEQHKGSVTVYFAESKEPTYNELEDLEIEIPQEISSLSPVLVDTTRNMLIITGVSNVHT